MELPELDIKDFIKDSDVVNELMFDRRMHCMSRGQVANIDINTDVRRVFGGWIMMHYHSEFEEMANPEDEGATTRLEVISRELVCTTFIPYTPEGMPPELKAQIEAGFANPDVKVPGLESPK